MELSLSGNALRTFHRSITCLARIGSELVLQSSPSQLVLHTLNSSRSAYQSVALRPGLFDVYIVSAPPPVQCSVLLKAVCSVLRTQIAGVDRLSVALAGSDAGKLQFSLECLNGVRKTYWITCNVEPDIQNLSLDRRRFPSNLVVRPRDLSRLLANFQSSLQEITVIATEPGAISTDDGGEIGGKAVEMRSYIDPNKDSSDTALHTQLWIDPAEEFVQYTHAGDPVDVTFSVKELKAFLSFCEGCEVDIHIYFEKTGEPILMAPKFGLDDGCSSDFDATLVLATMLISQLQKNDNSELPNEAAAQNIPLGGSQSQRSKTAGRSVASEHPSDHTKIWSELSGSSTREKQLQSNGGHTSGAENAVPSNSNSAQAIPNHVETDEPHLQDRIEGNGKQWTQHHPSNWVGEDDDGEDEDVEGEFVQSTPPY